MSRNVIMTVESTVTHTTKFGSFASVRQLQNQKPILLPKKLWILIL
jgi:hypothetical protein